MYYAPEIFKSAGDTTSSAFAQTIVVGAVNLALTLVALALVDRPATRSSCDSRAAPLCAGRLGSTFAPAEYDRMNVLTTVFEIGLVRHHGSPGRNRAALGALPFSRFLS